MNRFTKWFFALLLLAITHAGFAQEQVDWNMVPQILSRIVAPTFPNKDFVITKFGAKEGGKLDCTEAIAKAVAACNKSGGGRVVVPKGVFLTGPVHLKSNVNLHVSEGATLLFTRDLSKYLPLVLTRFEGNELMNYSPMIYAYGQENIAITGKGTIDGNGDSTKMWWHWIGPKKNSGKVSAINHGPDIKVLREMSNNNTPVEKRIFGEGHYLRINFVQPYNCKNVLIEDITILRSPMWELNPVLCTNVTVRGVQINTHGPNNDGCDPESCKDVLIENCSFNTGDDCIAIKSGREGDGRRIGVASENIIIRNCDFKDGHGGVVIGSEISGNCRNVFAENCTMDSPSLDRALRIKSNSMRGGILENIFMRNCKVGQVAEAVFLIDFNYEGGDVANFVPIVRNVRMENVTSQKSPYGLYFRGYDRSKIQDIYVDNCTFNGVEKKYLIEHAKNLHLNNLKINGETISLPDTSVSYHFSVRHSFEKDSNKVVFYLKLSELKKQFPKFDPFFSSVYDANFGKKVASKLLLYKGKEEGYLMVTADFASGEKIKTFQIKLNHQSTTPIQTITKQDNFNNDKLSISLLTAFKDAPQNISSQAMSDLVVNSVLADYPEVAKFNRAAVGKWNYESGYFLEIMLRKWDLNKKPELLDYAVKWVDLFVDKDGKFIEGKYKRDEFQLDAINAGKVLLKLYEIKKDKRYKTASDILIDQLKDQPKTSDGGYWHKKIYPMQMWLDGIFMADIFTSRYAQLFKKPALFNEVSHQLQLMYQHTYDPEKGLLYHGWDESKKLVWANQKTGASPSFWARGMGWYMMALVECLEVMPQNHPDRTKILEILKTLSKGLVQYQHPQSGMWYQVVDKINEAGNWPETSGTAMFAYALKRAVKDGYIDASYQENARKAYEGLKQNMLFVDENNNVHLLGTVKVGTLNPSSSDGSFNYYISTERRLDDLKGVSPFLALALEFEK